MNIGTIIRDVRQSKRLTLEDVGIRSGLSATYLSAIERGTKNDFRFSTLKSVAQALDIPLQALLLLAIDEDDIVRMEALVPNVRNDLKELVYRTARTASGQRT